VKGLPYSVTRKVKSPVAVALITSGPPDVGAADVAGGVIVGRRGVGDVAWDARQRELDADLNFPPVDRALFVAAVRLHSTWER
jgi:hypothetical protein